MNLQLLMYNILACFLVNDNNSLLGVCLKIGIIGAGWYGAHIGIALKKAGYRDVTIFEKTHDIFSKISGRFGIRLHIGPHYPRSEETRKHCRHGFGKFIKTYPDLVNKHMYSIYALGAIDANGDPPKVSAEQFKSICEESPSRREIDPKTWGYQNLLSAFEIDEPSIVIGERLREAFRAYLSNAGVEVFCNYTVKKIDKIDKKIRITNGKSSDEFDIVINATSYQSFLPHQPELPFDMEVVYQPCLALIYEDTNAGPRPISFIVMDGWFPCLMPYQEHVYEDGNYDNTYIMTHAKWTIMGSYQTPEEANSILEELSDNFVETKIKPPCESEMNRFWPEFNSRFKYIGWQGSVLVKLKTKREFRSAVTFKNNGIIHIIPGKINNIFDAEQEVLSLINHENILALKGYQFVKGGVLDTSINEIVEKPNPYEKNTCTLQTYSELRHEEKRALQKNY